MGRGSGLCHQGHRTGKATCIVLKGRERLNSWLRKAGPASCCGGAWEMAVWFSSSNESCEVTGQTDDGCCGK